ncbi:MAG: efflux RND transporter periplasmic adaptor subunit [Chitinophagaceae bacterium]
MKKSIFILLIIILLNACGSNKNNTSVAPVASEDTILEITLSKSQLEAMNINVSKPKKKDISKQLEVFGEIIALPTDRATVHSKVKGIVENIFVHEGQNVKKGAALFSISSPDIIDWQGAYLKAKGQLIYLEKEYQRQKLLAAQNINSKKNLEMAESDYFQAKSQLKVSCEKLQNVGIDMEEKDTNFIVRKSFIVRAPLSGNITEILVNIGSSTADNNALCQIVSNENLHARVQVHPVDIALIQNHMKADLYINNSQNSIPGDIKYISREINPITKSVSLHISIPYIKNILPGMPVKSKIYVQKKNAFLLPSSALYNDGEHSHIFYIHKILNDTNFVIRPYLIPKEFVSEKEFSVPDSFNTNLNVVIQGTHFINGEMHKDEMEE